MHISDSISRCQLLLIICLLVAGASGCSSLMARAFQSRTTQDSQEQFPGRGLRITEVDPNGPAAQAGLKPMDLIYRYGEFEITDKASFYAAREAYESSGDSGISIVIWRDGKAMKKHVGPGRLWMKSNEYNPVAYEFTALMDKLDALRQIPEYMRDREFKAVYTPEKILDEGKRLIDKAERESTLSSSQILLARIDMIPDESQPEDLKRLSDLLAQLVATQPASYVGTLGRERFFEKKRYRAAAACYKRYLEVNPADVSPRLNQAIAYNRLGLFAEAEAAADYVLDNQLPLSEHGFRVAYNAKAVGALGRGEYNKSIFFAEKALGISECHCDNSILMLAAAQKGDLQKFADAAHKFQQAALPEEVEPRKLPLAAVEAYALVKTNQRDRARAIVQKWKDTDRVEGRLKAHWAAYPGGADVWNNWNALSRN